MRLRLVTEDTLQIVVKEGCAVDGGYSTDRGFCFMAESLSKIVKSVL